MLPTHQIDAAKLQQRINDGEALNLLDVREAIEYYTFNIGGLNIPVSKLKENINSISYNKTDEIIVICSAVSGVKLYKLYLPKTVTKM
jgi:rhodanese-related sulfurtransferase